MCSNWEQGRALQARGSAMLQHPASSCQPAHQAAATAAGRKGLSALFSLGLGNVFYTGGPCFNDQS